MRIDLLKYQDPSSSMDLAPYIAIRHRSMDVAWLPLFLAYNLPTSHFPPEVHTATDRLHIVTEDENGKRDIRTLEDNEATA